MRTKQMAITGFLLLMAVARVAAVGVQEEEDAQTAFEELDLRTMTASTEFGTLEAERVDDSFVGTTDDGQILGIASLDDVTDATGTQGMVAHLYGSPNYSLLIGEADADGVVRLESVDGSRHDATLEFVIENGEAVGTLTIAGEEPIEFALSSATGDAGVYWASGTDEAPEARGDWVVFDDGRQWGCVCTPPGTNACCHLAQY
jgi:hypothetical protein